MHSELINDQLESIPHDVWEEARTREQIIKPLAAAPHLSRYSVADAAVRLNLKRSSVYRLIALYRKRPQLSSLLPGRDGRPRNSRMLPPSMDTLIRSNIDTFYLTRERPRVSDLMLQIRAACKAKGWTPPDYKTVARRVKDLDPKEVTKARKGGRRAREQFGPISARNVEAKALSVIQIDHTLVDVIVVDEQQRQPIGRPWVTFAIDIASRVIAGFYLSLDAPSALSVALVITHAVLPKETWLAERQIELPWPVAGLPDSLHLDNAKEFHSEALKRGTEEYGIKLTWRPPATPHFGGHIERLIGTFMGKVHLLPGTTFSNVQERDRYDSEKTATMTLAELERWLTMEILGVYHCSIHTALKKPPPAAWAEGIAQRKEPVRMPTDPVRFFRDFLPGERRLIRRTGIQLFNIFYWDGVLSRLAGRSDRKVVVKYDPRNLSRVFFQDEQGQYWPIPYQNLGLPPISLAEHRVAMRKLKEEGRRLVDEKTLFETIEAQRAVVAEAGSSTRQRRQAESHRRAMRSTKMPAMPSTPLDTTPDGSGGYEDLPPFPVEEWS